MPIHIALIAEDVLSENVARKILAETGAGYQVDKTWHLDKDRIKQKINGFNQSAKGYPYFVLTDQDTPDNCPPTAIGALSAPLHPNLLYRFAVMEVEAWLLADKSGIARFLEVSDVHIPSGSPDEIQDPKRSLINAARHSRNRSIRDDIIPSETGMSRDYNGCLSQFVRDHWNIQTAANNSPSLHRTFTRLKSFTPNSE